MATFVLVPGAWLGGWVWEPTARRLRLRGHDVHPVTLTGLGERARLGGPEVDLDTHVADVVNLVRDEGLDDVVLLGHSYAGIVVTGAADRRWLRDHATDHPFGTYTQPLRLRNATAEPLPKVLVSSSFPLEQVRELIAGGHPWFAALAGPEWQLLELRTGHWPMASRPDDLADLLDGQVA